MEYSAQGGAASDPRRRPDRGMIAAECRSATNRHSAYESSTANAGCEIRRHDQLIGLLTHNIAWRSIVADQNVVPIALSKPASDLGRRLPDDLAVMAYIHPVAGGGDVREVAIFKVSLFAAPQIDQLRERHRA